MTTKVRRQATNEIRAVLQKTTKLDLQLETFKEQFNKTVFNETELKKSNDRPATVLTSQIKTIIINHDLLRKIKAIKGLEGRL